MQRAVQLTMQDAAAAWTDALRGDRLVTGRESGPLSSVGGAAVACREGRGPSATSPRVSPLLGANASVFLANTLPFSITRTGVSGAPPLTPWLMVVTGFDRYCRR